ncbi:MAG TPA: sigma factor [Leptolyngbyaceae cyanobacterium]
MKPQKACHAKIEELLMAYHQNPSVDLHNQLVRLHMGLVRKLVHRICQQQDASYLELEEAGLRGLTVAIETYTPSQGLSFISFAVPCIHATILDLLNQSKQSSRVFTLLKKIGEVPIFRFTHLT